jgi:hypothetical protein
MTSRSPNPLLQLLRFGFRSRLEYAQAIATGWNRALAILAVINVVLVGFNATYIHWRSSYLAQIPELVAFYDPVRGISAHPDTQRYLGTVDRLQEVLDAGADLRSPEISERLADLRSQSQQIIIENPFAISGQTEAYGKLQQQIRDRLNQQSSRVAWDEFWSAAYLEQETPDRAFTFFDSKLRPLLAANFTREIGADGGFVDQFSWIDTSFIALFAIDLLLQALYSARNTPDVSLIDALLRRWYDLFLVLPLYRWLRVIPMTVRLQHAGLLDLRRVIAQITYVPAAQLADRLSSFVLVRLINQVKEDIEEGKLVGAIVNPQANYVRVGAADKVERAIDITLQLALVRILPQLQPDVAGLLRYNLHGSIGDSALYRSLSGIPGIAAMPQDAIDSLANTLAQATCQGLAEAYQDEDGRVLFEEFSDNFKRVLRDELRDELVQQDLEQALVEILEEIKLNYVKGVPDRDPEETLSEADRLLMAETLANPAATDSSEL